MGKRRIQLLPSQERFKNITLLGLPIVGGMLSQSVLNLVDAAMVGSLGEAALAGVGLGGYANFVIIALVMGLGVGVQATVARRRGEGRNEQLAAPLNHGLFIAALLSLPLMLLCWFNAEHIIGLLSDDGDVIAIGSDYFQWRTLAVIAVGWNFAYRGYWNGIRQTGRYLQILVAMHVFNVVISYGLIFGHFGLPEMGAAGSGLGTSIAMFLGTGMYFLLTWHTGRRHGFMRSLPSLTDIRFMLRLSVPNSLQQFFFATGVTALFWIIGQIGTAELAIAHVLVNLALLLILPGVGLGMAATTLVSHSLGEQQPQEAYRWGWDVVRVAVVTLFIMGLPFWLVPELILQAFTRDPELLTLGIWPLRITGLGMTLDAIALVLTQALLGAGASRTVMSVNLGSQWLIFLPCAYLAGPILGGGLLAVWLLQSLYRVMTSVIFAIMWERKHWADIQI
ncbi:MATE family efflux transporter [Halopseudomonas bauzanensis]|uniref:Multidrug-efflux transporter n=1 Tax=Halopseudomonas bauzanensis TaxID=653930 RepID=A0A1I4N0S5_9GAMM|nr:MATE family efflux transporter [Halopseudomonas bauzanensis]SES09415.1 putative efflux protein, MATE family [Halopseudomonas bauzanensis]SFM08927.1 putative efflux protein, MATE family [Halopseudomonas bauzanensis]